MSTTEQRATLCPPRPRAFLRAVFLGAALLGGVFAGGCGTAARPPVPDPVPDDRRDVPAPKRQKVLHAADAFDNQTARPVERAFDLSRQLRRLAGKRKEALNVDAFDGVRDSSWFTNRNSERPMTIEEIRRGPDRGSGPDPAGPWTVVAAKAEGVTPGFTIEDPTGARYVIKFDPAGWPELATGAEVVSTKLFYAMGYHTPENYIVEFDPAILRLGKDVTIEPYAGKERPMTERDLQEILARVEKHPEGTMRAVASKFLEGKILGPFKYRGTRRDDPNDFVPHEHRRELRGLRILAAWLNNYDIKANNSMDVFVEDQGRRYVRHYLLDFSSALGSQSDEPMPVWTGFENTVDPAQILKNTMGLGLYVPAWEKDRRILHRSIGLFDWEKFDPLDYKFIYPNAAFASMTDRDGFWAAKIVTSFTDEQLRAAVDTGLYSDPNAAEYLLDVIIRRRDTVGRYYFDRMTPVDRFEVSSGPGGPELRCADLAVETGLHEGSSKLYRWELRRNGESFGEPVESPHPPRFPLPETEGELEVVVRCRVGDGSWAKPVSAFLRAHANPGEYVLIAVERHD